MSAVSNVRFHEHGAQKKIYRDIFDVSGDYAKNPYRTVKAFYVLGIDVPRALGWLSNDKEAETYKTATRIKSQATFFKLTRAPGNLLNSLNITGRSLWSWWTGNPVANGKEKKATVKPLHRAVRDATQIINPCKELWELCIRLALAVETTAFKTLKGVNGVALAFSMSWNACESIYTLGKDRVSDLTNADQVVIRQQENIKALLKLITQVAFVAIGIIGALTVFASVAVNSLVMTALSATTVVFSILEFYYSNIGQEKKIT